MAVLQRHPPLCTLPLQTAPPPPLNLGLDSSLWQCLHTGRGGAARTFKSKFGGRVSYPSETGKHKIVDGCWRENRERDKDRQARTSADGTDTRSGQPFLHGSHSIARRRSVLTSTENRPRSPNNTGTVALALTRWTNKDVVGKQHVLASYKSK